MNADSNLDVRKLWLNYYAGLGFEVIPSASLVHPAFPLSFNMSAGLVQLDPSIRSKTKIEPYRQCLIQKCFRHFDVGKVGDETHLSFFEMAGSFEVVEFDLSKTVKNLWEFFVNVIKLDPKDIWITCFNKDNIYSTEIKQEQSVINWLSSTVKTRLVLADKKTNFWTQGGGINFTDNIKLCGPQVEFFLNLNKQNNQTRNPLTNPDSFLEIGNIIAIRYYIESNNLNVKNLLNPATETVIGIERVASTINAEGNIFATPYFKPIIQKFNSDLLNSDIKIITDHLKALCFIFSEEIITPGKKDRNFVIKVLIRNMLTSFYVLNISPKETIPLLVDEIIKIYAEIYPDIKRSKSDVINMILSHQEKYKLSLERGSRKIKSYMKKNNISTIGDKEKLFFKNTFGIPEKLISKLT